MTTKLGRGWDFGKDVESFSILSPYLFPYCLRFLGVHNVLGGRKKSVIFLHNILVMLPNNNDSSA